MKMKKILSGLLAATMTVTAVTVTSLTLNADNTIPETFIISEEEKTITSTWAGIYEYAKGSDLFNQLPNYETFAIDFEFGETGADEVNATAEDNYWKAAQVYQLCAVAPDDTNWENQQTVQFGTSAEEVSADTEYTATVKTSVLINNIKELDEDGLESEVKLYLQSSQVSDSKILKIYLKDPVDPDAEKVEYTPLSTTIDELEVEIGENPPYNWQGLEEFTVDGYTAETLADMTISKMTVEFNVISAVSDGNAFDPSKINYQININAQNGDSWPWICIGSSTFDSDTNKVTVTANIENDVHGGNFDLESVFLGFRLVAMVDYADAEAPITLKIGNVVPVTDITLDQESLFLLVDDTATLTATVTPENATDKTVTWKSNNEDVATVDEEGVVTAVGKGTATITATAGEKSATCRVTVAEPAKEIVLEAMTVLVGEEKTITYSIDPEDAEISNIQYTSSDTEIFTVENGKVQGVSAGSATLTMTAANAGNAKLTATCTVTVSAEAIPATKVELSKTELELEEGETATLNATVAPENTTDTLTWSSSDETVATVDNTGKVTAVKEGTATITVKANDDVSASCEVTVIKVPQGENDPDDGLVIEVEDEDITIEADAGVFDASVTVVKAEVSVSENVADEKTEAIEGAVSDILDGEDAEGSVTVNSVISITLKDQDGNEIQPAEDGVVTITVPYDGDSTHAAYIDGETPEFIKLSIDEDEEYASFDVKHFSDYYLVTLSDEAADAVDKEDDGSDNNDNGDESTFKGSVTLKGENWWAAASYGSDADYPISDLIGDLDPDEVKSITFISEDYKYTIGYNPADGGEWVQFEDVPAGESLVCTDILLKSIAAPTEEDPDEMADPYVMIAISADNGVDYTISWVATTKDGSGEDEDKDDDEDEDKDETVLWEGETELLSDWSASLTIANSKIANAKAGDIITVYYSDVQSGAQLQLKYSADGWPALPGQSVDGSEWGSDNYGYEIAEGTSKKVYTLTEEDIAMLDGNDLIIAGQKLTLTKVTLTIATADDGNDGNEDPDETTAPSITVPSGSFGSPSTSGGSSSDDTTSTTAPAATEDNSAANTTAPSSTNDNGGSSADNNNEGAQPEDGAAAPEGGSGSAGNTTAGNVEDKNVATGVAIALIPALAAAAGVIISKKRK